MLTKRIFPRYYLDQFKQKVHVEGFDKEIFFLKDASLGGIGLVGEQDFSFNQITTFTLTFSKFTYKLQGKIAWKEWDLEKRQLRVGVSLLFGEKEAFKSYLNFIKSLHNLRLKKVATLQNKDKPIPS